MGKSKSIRRETCPYFSPEYLDYSTIVFYFSTMKKYDFIAWQDEGIWTAHSPSVPGVYGVGDTRREAQDDLANAILELFAYLSDIGERAPAPKQITSGVLEIR